MYVERWKQWKQRSQSELPFEVELESQLYDKYGSDISTQPRPQLAETTSLPAPRRLSNPIPSPPRLRTKTGNETPAQSVQSRLVSPNAVSQQPSVGAEAILKLFDVYGSEMNRRKEQLYLI